MADDAAYLEELKDKRRKLAGVDSTSFSDQSLSVNHKALNDEIRRLERKLARTSGTRLAATRKGV